MCYFLSHLYWLKYCSLQDICSVLTHTYEVVQSDKQKS